jgi:hypothetical protein
MNGLFVCLLYRSHLIRFANDNDKHANAGQLNSATHLRALLVLRYRGMNHAYAMMTIPSGIKMIKMLMPVN